MTGLDQSLPPGVPLILKASCDERIKRIRFPPDLALLQFSTFQQRIARSLQFEDVDFCITWEDDDGEHVSDVIKTQGGKGGWKSMLRIVRCISLLSLMSTVRYCLH
jgi:hypothetical protein